MKKTYLAAALTMAFLSTAPLFAQESELESIAKEARSFVAALNADGKFDGVVLLAKDGVPFFHEAYGLASRRYDAPNKPDTKFNLGSMNKMFTAVAIGQLVEADKMSFNDTIDKWLSPVWVSEEVGKKVKVGQLLNHTAGFGDYFNEEFIGASRARFRELADYKEVMPRELLFEPGSKFQYSNAGLFLAGVIVEKVSGQNYFDYIRAHIYKPAGMINTDCYDTDTPVKNLAIGYYVDEGGTLRNNYFAHSARGGPAGGGFSTAQDQLRFAIAMTENKLVSKEVRDILWTPQPNTRGYGYGFGTRAGWYGHNGGAPGISAWMSTNPESGYTIVAFANFGSVRDVYMKMRQLIDAKK